MNNLLICKGISKNSCSSLAFLLFTFILIAPAAVQTLKEHDITLRVQNEPVESVFDKISKQTNFKSLYDQETVNKAPRVSFDIKNVSLEQTLGGITSQAKLYFNRTDHAIAVSKQPLKKEETTQRARTIQGIVADDKGESVIGVSVQIKGGGSGTITDIDGRYSLMNVPESATLTISYIGYKTVNISTRDKNTAKIMLVEDSKMVDEVVVVGYGVQRKRDVSIPISPVEAEQIADVSTSDFRQALAGKMPGVQVTQSSGDPEGSVGIRVCGIGTVNASSDPLYIIDGVPVERGSTNLNNNDVESVEVLKDASSVVIHGSRGSNGVITIATKQGQSEKMKVQYDGYYGIQSVSKKLSMMNAYQFVEFAKDGHDNAYLDANPGGSPDGPNGMRSNSWERIPTELFPYLSGDKGLTDTDWQDAIFHTAATTSHNVSISGRGKAVGYFIPANYHDKEGITINSDFKKYSMRMNLDGKYKGLKFGLNFSPSYSTSNRVDAPGSNDIMQSALMMPPVWPVYNTDSSYNYQGSGYWRIGNDYQHNAVLNPVAMANLQSNVIDHTTIVGKVFAELELYKGFTYNIFFGGDYYGSHNDRYRSSELLLLGQKYHDVKSNPTTYSSSGFYFSWLVENEINYNTMIKDAHSINVVLVQSAQREIYKGDNVTATDFSNDYIQTISGGMVTKDTSGKTQWTIVSYLARMQYSYKSRYMASAAIRADGSSHFGKNDRQGYFPSASPVQRISGEDFFMKAKCPSFVDGLRLRASYEVIGNFRIGNYNHLFLMALGNYVLDTSDGQLADDYKLSTIKNEDLSWEKNVMINVGVDLQMFKGLLGLTVDYYNTDTSNMSLNVSVPHLTRYSTVLMNIGKVNNRGWEVALTLQKNITKDFGCSFNANYATNTNEVKALDPGNTLIISIGSADHAYYITKVSELIGCYYLLVQDGIFSNEEELKKYSHFSNTQLGDFCFVGIDGDGVMDLDKDRTIVGNYMPDFTYGFGGKVQFKGSDLDFNSQGVYDNEILNLNRHYIDNLEGNTNGTTIALNRWKSPEDLRNGQVNHANRKSKGYNGRTSTRHLEDGSYLRLQNMALGYTLPKNLVQRFFVEKLRVYVSGQNLWTSTNYSGYNPEVNARPSNSLSPSEDYGTYPLAKAFLFGLNITL